MIVLVRRGAVALKEAARRCQYEMPLERAKGLHLINTLSVVRLHQDVKCRHAWISPPTTYPCFEQSDAEAKIFPDSSTFRAAVCIVVVTSPNSRYSNTFSVDYSSFSCFFCFVFLYSQTRCECFGIALVFSSFFFFSFLLSSSLQEPALLRPLIPSFHLLLARSGGRLVSWRKPPAGLSGQHTPQSGEQALPGRTSQHSSRSVPGRGRSTSSSHQPQRCRR